MTGIHRRAVRIVSVGCALRLSSWPHSFWYSPLCFDPALVCLPSISLSVHHRSQPQPLQCVLTTSFDIPWTRLVWVAVEFRCMARRRGSTSPRLRVKVLGRLVFSSVAPPPSPPLPSLLFFFFDLSSLPSTSSSSLSPSHTHSLARSLVHSLSHSLSPMSLATLRHHPSPCSQAHPTFLFNF